MLLSLSERILKSLFAVQKIDLVADALLPQRLGAHKIVSNGPKTGFPPAMITIQPQPCSFFQQLEGAIIVLEHLAVQAAHSSEPCAQILFRAAELLRVTTLPEPAAITSSATLALTAGQSIEVA
jgi:hypothetical protein